MGHSNFFIINFYRVMLILLFLFYFLLVKMFTLYYITLSYTYLPYFFCQVKIFTLTLLISSILDWRAPLNPIKNE